VSGRSSQAATRLSARGWPRAFQVAVGSALFWTALGVFFASQLVLAGLPWSTALAFSMPRWYSWGLLTPVVFWIDRRLGGHQDLAARATLHVPLGIAVTCLSIAMRLLTRPLRGSPWPANLWAFFVERFYWDLLIYAVIAGVAIARDLGRRSRQREAEAHRLALQAADLQRRLTEASLQSLRAQVHPHFLFNALNTISAFTETDPQTARRLMEQLGDLLRASLAHASRPVVTLGEELTFLDDYLGIELARFEGRLTVSVNADDDLLDEAVPSFLLQPLLENAIRHGIGRRMSGGHVDVTATRDGSILTVRVRDNGVGLPVGWRFDRDAGIGLQNVAARLKHLYGRGDLLRITPVAEGGVNAEVDLPRRSPTASAAPARAVTAHT
jgi:two-component system LytT family sensor kinase